MPISLMPVMLAVPRKRNGIQRAARAAPRALKPDFQHPAGRERVSLCSAIMSGAAPRRITGPTGHICGVDSGSGVDWVCPSPPDPPVNPDPPRKCDRWGR